MISEQENPIVREAAVTFLAITLFFGLIIFLFSQVLVFAASGLGAVIVSYFTLNDFQHYVLWLAIPFEFVALGTIWKIMKKSYSAKKNFVEGVRVIERRGFKMNLLNERRAAVTVLVTGLFASAWFLLIDHLGSPNGTAPIVWIVILAFGAAFMLCFVVARSILSRTIRFDSVAGLLFTIVGIWYASRH